jgi:mono/diheme cytochrome c family protein
MAQRTRAARERTPSFRFTCAATNELGRRVFATAACGSCHTLADADASGTIGPNLDTAEPTRALVVERVTNGKGGMPAFKARLTPEQIDNVADYVSSIAGGSG